MAKTLVRDRAGMPRVLVNKNTEGSLSTWKINTADHCDIISDSWTESVAS